MTDAPERIWASRDDIDGWRWPRASKFPEQGPRANVEYIRADLTRATDYDALAAKLAEAEAEYKKYLRTMEAKLFLADERAEAAEAALPAVYRLGRADAAKDLDDTGDSAATRALSQRLCCNGHHCGCQGADVGTWLAHAITNAPTPTADALMARLKEETGQ